MTPSRRYSAFKLHYSSDNRYLIPSSILDRISHPLRSITHPHPSLIHFHPSIHLSTPHYFNPSLTNPSSPLHPNFTPAPFLSSHSLPHSHFQLTPSHTLTPASHNYITHSLFLSHHHSPLRYSSVPPFLRHSFFPSLLTCSVRTDSSMPHSLTPT